MMSSGNSASETSGEIAPSSDGPRAMPATTSPITRGWPTATAAIPSRRASTTTTATAMKKAAKTLPASRRSSPEMRSVPGGGGAPSGRRAPGGSSTRLRLRSMAVPTTRRRGPLGQFTLPSSSPST